MAHQFAVEARGLRKRFGTTQALAGLDLAVPAGQVCGLLGPNGAGKTTAVRVLSTLTRPDEGSARVAGYDVVREAASVRRSIGLAGQFAAVDEGITGRDNLRLMGRLHHLGARRARQRADELLERFGLTEAADRLVKGYSGGMRRRLDLLASLVTEPPVLFLDEPTTGLDPRSRHEIWSAVRELARAGTTVLLTTQYLEEADRLADAVVVIDHGAVIAHGPPGRLKEGIGVRVQLTLLDEAQLGAAGALLRRLTGGEAETDPAELTVAAAGRRVELLALARELEAAGLAARDVSVREPSLDDVFLALTGAAAVPVGRAA